MISNNEITLEFSLHVRRWRKKVSAVAKKNIWILAAESFASVLKR